MLNIGRVHTAKIHSTIAWHHIDMVVRQSHPLGLAQPREPEHTDLLGDALPVVGGHKSLQALPQLPPHSLHPGHHRPQLLLPITSLRWVKQNLFQQGSCWSTRRHGLPYIGLKTRVSWLWSAGRETPSPTTRVRKPILSPYRPRFFPKD